MDLQTIVLIVIVIGILISAGVSFFKQKPTFNMIVKKLKELCYDLFLTAEKQDWVNEEKMAWCVKKILEALPELKLNIDQEMVQLVAQYIYNQYKANAKKFLSEDSTNK